LLFRLAVLFLEILAFGKGRPLLLPKKNRIGRGAVFLVIFLSVYPFFWACRSDDQVQLSSRSKITFNLEQLNENGLYGVRGGLKALHYEFCIPADPGIEAQVRQIDPTSRIFKTSPGRIGCGAGEYLCVGHTHQPDFRTVLFRLANLPYVRRIDQAFFE
jgi:hypothetical protein